MQRVDLTPDDAAELTALFAEYGWWADRTESNVREALANSVAVGIRDDGTSWPPRASSSTASTTRNCTT